MAWGLFKAASQGHLEIVRELAWAGANLGPQHPVGGDTALTIAAFTGKSEVVQFVAAYRSFAQFQGKHETAQMLRALPNTEA